MQSPIWQVSKRSTKADGTRSNYDYHGIYLGNYLTLSNFAAEPGVQFYKLDKGFYRLTLNRTKMTGRTSSPVLITAAY